MLHFWFLVDFIKTRNQALSTESIAHGFIPTKNILDLINAWSPEGLQNSEEPLGHTKEAVGRGKTQIEEPKVLKNQKWKMKTLHCFPTRLAKVSWTSSSPLHLSFGSTAFSSTPGSARTCVALPSDSVFICTPSAVRHSATWGHFLRLATIPFCGFFRHLLRSSSQQQRLATCKDK